jgi:hypothetical protein
MTTVKRSEKGLQKLADQLIEQRATLPRSRRGGIEIRHRRYKPGQSLMLVNMRVALLTGLPLCEYTCKKPTVIHELYSKEHGTWMTDLPCELVQMHDELAKHARGTVLVGGLGLGILPRMVAQMERVKRVVVVEQDQRVVDLVWPLLEPQLLGKGEVRVADIHSFEPKRKEFTVALLDTWQNTSEMTWVFDVVPLRRRFRHAIRSIHCWQEDAMLSQVSRHLFGIAAIREAEDIKSPACAHSYAFVKGLDRMHIKRHRYMPGSDSLKQLASIEEARMANYRDRAVYWAASLFLHHVGSPQWERMFGDAWDEAIKARE